MIGRSISHYRIIKKLGEGGMGVVYLAEDTQLERPVAIKFLRESTLAGPEEQRRFTDEARAAAALNHPSICTIHEINEDEGRTFIVMEYVEGRTLASLIAEGPLALERAVGIATQVAEGLDAAHARQIVHRDIKPANIMITAAGRAKIMDFGLAVAADRTRLTRPGTTLGTAAYMSPEQARGEEIDHRSDIWSLGIVLYEMVTGRRPFQGDLAQAVVYKIVKEEPPPPTALRTGVPMELEHVILKALAKRRNERYQHADDLLADLRRLARTLETETEAVTASITRRGEPVMPPKTERTDRARRRRWFVASVAVVAAAVGAYLLLERIFTDRRLVAAPKPVAVIQFDNMTGDPSYDYLSAAIPNLLITSLEQSPYLRVTTWERMGDLLGQLGESDAARIDAELGFQVCRLDGIDVIVTGSFVKAGNTFATDVKALDVQTKNLILSASARGDGPESILKQQIDHLSKQIAQAVGISPRWVERKQRPVSEVTTGSMDAYNYYLRGVQEYEKFYFEDACFFFKKAVAIDSTFAMAHMYLASTNGNLRDTRGRNKHYEAAMRHSQNATERERLYIRARYASVIEQDRKKYKRLLKELVREYPKEKTALYWLASDALAEGHKDDAIGFSQRALALDPGYAAALNELAYAYIEKGEYERAIEYLERYAAVSPGDANPLDSMAEVYFRMGNLEQAIARYKEAIEVKPDFYLSMRNVAYLYGVAGDYDRALEWIDRYIESTPTEGLRLMALGWRSVLLFLTGQMDTALGCLDQWERSLGGESRYDTAAQDFLRGIYLLSNGRYNDAERAFGRWREGNERVWSGHDARARAWQRGYLALVQARSDRAEAALENITAVEEWYAGAGEEERFVEPHTHNGFFLIMAEVLLANRRYDEAIAVVRDSVSMEIPRMEDSTLLIHNCPFEGDVVGRAYEQMGNLSQAAAEYKRLIRFDPKSQNRRLRNPIYHYRLGKIYERMGRQGEARDQYSRFLSYWRNADRDLPEYVDAQGRMAALGNH